MTAADRVARILALVPWLLQRPGASVEETAGAFGVDRITLLQDLDTIGYCGLPGLGGGDLFEVDIVEDRILVRMADELSRPLRLTPTEALRLVLAGETVFAALEEDLPELRSAVDRIREAVGMPSGTTVRLQDEGAELLGPIRRAIREQRRMRITYAGRADDAPTRRHVSPRTLHLSQGSWYLQGRDDALDEERTFRLDRIAALEVLDERAEPHDAPSRPPRYEPGSDDVLVELLLEPPGRWIAESVVPEETEEKGDGALRLRLWTDAPRWIGELVLAAAPHVHVISPPSLTERVHESALEALSAYDPAVETD